MTTNGYSERALARRALRRAGTPIRKANADLLACMYAAAVEAGAA